MPVVLFVSPHPDDLELFCGGTLLEHAKCGDQLHVILMTKGGKGTLNPFLKEHQLEQIRTAEAHTRYGLIPNLNLLFAGFKDKEIAPTQQSSNKMSALLNTLNPDIIYIPEFQSTLSHYHHPDHVHTGTLITQAIQPQQKPVRLRCYHSKQTNLLITIQKEHYKENNRAIKLYKSQNKLLSNGPFMLSILKLQYNKKRRAWGKQNGTRYAEGFREF